jgi:signal transduction histidine kinase/DNA-binding NarL/FixJ family response regulator
METVDAARILVVDDEQANLDLLDALLASEGYTNVTCTRDPHSAAALFASETVDLVLLDLHMPHMSGLDLLRDLRAHTPAQELRPVLVLTADVTTEAKQRALAGGASDFLTKPLDSMEVLLRVRNLLQIRLLHCEQRAARHRAELLAEASRVLSSSFDYRSTLDALTRLAVPALADYCVLDLRDGPDTFTRAAVAHADPAKDAILREIGRLGPDDLLPDHPARRAVEQGETTLIPEIGPGTLEALIRSPAHRQIIEQLNPRSLVAAPLTVDHRNVGALLLVTAESDRRYGDTDLELVQELARRASLAVDNALLYLEAQRATRARDEVLAVVAHDLRNPLGTIEMASSFLIEQSTDAQARRHLEIVHRSATRMNQMIHDLLDVTRIESGRLALELVEASPAPLLQEAWQMLEPLARARGLTLCLDAAPTLPAVRMDAARVLQVISNLVGNAVKFTPEGGEVSIHAEALDDEVRISIRDTGPGITPDKLPHVFSRFWQADPKDRRGIGMGLSIAQGIVEGHGGRIWVESQPGEGSVFRFTLRCAVPAAEGRIAVD